MPKTVAILEGDSTGLVKSIKQAKDEMLTLEAGGKTLTRQLKDVATEADKAAGSLVNRIGGSTAIKAIGAVTIGMTAANTALGTFSSSMAAFASTQGEKGAKAMADLDMAVNNLQGQLFTAVMGTDDLQHAMTTIMDVMDAVTITTKVLLAPLGLLGGLVRTLAGDETDAALATERLKRANDDYATSMATANQLTNDANASYAGLQKTIIGLVGTKKEAALFDVMQTKNEIMSFIRKQEMADFARTNSTLNLAMDKAEAAERLKMGESYMEAFRTQATRRIDKVREAAREEAAARLEEERAGQNAQLVQARAALVALDEQADAINEGKTSTKENVVRTAASRETASGPFSFIDLIPEKLQETLRLVKETGDKVQGFLTGFSPSEGFVESWKTMWDGLTEDGKSFIQNLIAENQKLTDAIKSQDQEVADAKMKEQQAVAQEYGRLAGQQLAAGEKASKVAEKLARKALGGQISALGDKAMAEAAILGAALNPLAIPMAAAGVAAYAAAAALGSDAKKATASTPAAAPAATQMNTNVSYNLQVDAAFANGESIARQFSMAQREAQRRGMLVPAGAF